MSILDKASLIQIPSGYKSTKLYSLRPSNGDGDFTFARSSSATRVNSEGLIEVAKVLGTTEEVTNGDFATDSDWVKAPSGVTISGGSANFNASADSYVYQDIITVGKTYKVTFSGVITSGAFYIGENGQAVNIFTSGTYVNQEATFTVLASTRFIIRASSVPFIGSIDNVSVKEVFENDVPRLDYSGGASCASLLLEGQSTNLATYSQNYNSAWWLYQNGTISDGGSGLFYLNPSSKVIKYESTTVGYNQMMLKLPSNVTIGNTYTQQGYVKCNDAPYIHFQVHPITNGPRVVWDNVNKEVITSPSSIDSVNIISLNDGWIKAEITYTASQASIYASIKTYFSTSSTSHYAGVPIGTIAYQTFVQVEQQSYATSYIPTSGSTVTRTADVCNNAGTSATFNSTEGVLFAEIAALADSTSTSIYSISDGTNTNTLYVGFSSTSNTIQAQLVVGGVAQTAMNYVVTDRTQYNKVAVLYENNNHKMYINGIEAAVDTSGSVPSADTFDRLNFDLGQGSFDFQGKVKQLMTFNEALSDEELSDLTGQVNLSFNNLATFYGYTIL